MLSDTNVPVSVEICEVSLSTEEIGVWVSVDTEVPIIEGNVELSVKNEEVRTGDVFSDTEVLISVETCEISGFTADVRGRVRVGDVLSGTEVLTGVEICELSVP